MNHQLVAAALCCALAAAFPAVAATQASSEGDQSVRAFVEQTDRQRPADSNQRSITVGSLNLLDKAIESLAQRGGAQVRIADDIARLRVNIRGYQAGVSDGGPQSARLRRTLVQASGLIERLVTETSHVRRPRDPELKALRRAAESLDESQSLRSQPDVIERFFRHAASILQRLDRQPTRAPEV
jgi:hypothetical protein